MLFKYKDAVISIIIKTIIKKYYYLKLMNLEETEILLLEKQKINNVDYNLLLDRIDEKFEKKAIANGVKLLSSKIFANLLDEFYDKIQHHLCWEDCDNASPLKCEKIANARKKKINQYDFIISGYQIFDEKGNLETFVVSDCKNYKKMLKKELTREDLEKVRKTKEDIRMNYFDSETMEEALLKQQYLLKSGQIMNPRGKKPNEYAIIKLKRKGK